MRLMPFSLLEISGHSMEPALKEKQRVWLFRWALPSVGQIDAFRKDGKLFVKRVSKISGDKFYFEGDNRADSLHVGWVLKKDVEGRVLL